MCLNHRTRAISKHFNDFILKNYFTSQCKHIPIIKMRYTIPLTTTKASFSQTITLYRQFKHWNILRIWKLQENVTFESAMSVVDTQPWGELEDSEASLKITIKTDIKTTSGGYQYNLVVFWCQLRAKYQTFWHVFSAIIPVPDSFPWGHMTSANHLLTNHTAAPYPWVMWPTDHEWNSKVC